jgi:hypothetical protein
VEQIHRLYHDQARRECGGAGGSGDAGA